MRRIKFKISKTCKSITMCPPGNHHNGFMATPELGYRMYGYTLWGRIALWNITNSLIVINKLNKEYRIHRFTHTTNYSGVC